MRIPLKITFALLFLSLLLVRPTPSYAYWHGHSYVGINLGVWPGAYYGYGYGYPYYPYYANPYYAEPGYVVAASSSYQPVVVNGVTYYVNNGAYYVYTQYGYQAVAAPAGATVPAVQAASVAEAPVTAAAADTDTDNSFTINIPNNKGGYTAVLLKRSGNGFVGPQGEFYAEFPKVSQLRAMYGK